MIGNLTIRSVVAIAVLLVLGGICSAQIAIRVGFAPPELPVYEQPVCPGDNYFWTPGYWAWDADGDDYYWVPGTWVLAPEVGYFWTPPYWGWADNAYVFYPGYWGPQVGFYGGIVYGFGYFGHGFEGGRWEGGHFFYNRYVSNVNVTVVHNVYETRMDTRNVNVARVSYNGGHGGIDARPTSQEEAFARERHVGPTSAQTQHLDAARGNPQFRATANHGKPPVAATARAGEFNRDTVAAREGGKYTPPPNRGNVGGDGNGGAGRQPVHPNELPAMERPTAPNTGSAKLDQKYQQQQQKLYDKQNQERQKLQQQQEKEHQKFQQQQEKQARQQQNEEQQRQMQQRQQQMEQRHQQQTQQMDQRHTQERQQMQQRQAPPAQHEAAPHH